MDTITTESRMRQARKRLGLTLEQLAERVPATFQHLQMIEVGKRLPSLELAYQIADQLGVDSIRELFPVQQEIA